LQPTAATAANNNLLRLIAWNTPSVEDGKLANAFWQVDNRNYGQLVAWLRSRDVWAAVRDTELTNLYE
jgi:hypothetical protein